MCAVLARTSALIFNTLKTLKNYRALRSIILNLTHKNTPNNITGKLTAGTAGSRAQRRDKEGKRDPQITLA
jgi:hypothetical protein